ncbi:MAG: hypothetical protein LBN31_12340 [Hungatella sp.]|jgi:hypothetical protein|nr:hypothetical protein [Hungatella sp.]
MKNVFHGLELKDYCKAVKLYHIIVNKETNFFLQNEFKLCNKDSVVLPDGGADCPIFNHTKENREEIK